MRKAWAIIIPLVVIAIVVGLTVGLYMLGDSESSALEKFRDIMIVYLGFLWVIVVLLLAVLVGVLVWVALMIKDKVIPLLETTQETVARLKGTAEFMSEEAASPVISFAGSVAKVRTMSKVFTGRDGRGKKTAGPGGIKPDAEKVESYLRQETNIE